MAKFYNARNDKVFKAIFFDPNDTELLETLLSLTFNTKVTDIKFNNPEQNVIKRAKTYDFTAHLDNKIAHIELTNKYDQSKNFYYFINFYRKYAESQYNPNDIFIHIDYTYGLSEDYNPILCYSLQTDDQIKLFDNMYLLEFNMDKIKNLWPNITD